MQVFACSGPHAGELISKSIAFGFEQAVVVGILFMVSMALYRLSMRALYFPSLLLGLLVLHPAWTVSAISGDCGILKRGASEVVTAIAIIILGVQLTLLIMSRVRSRRSST
jgi:hypothetical protein